MALVNRWSPLIHTSQCMTTSWTSSHTDESKSKPCHATQDIFTPDAIPAATLPISVLENLLSCIITARKMAQYIQTKYEEKRHSPDSDPQSAESRWSREQPCRRSYCQAVCHCKQICTVSVTAVISLIINAH